MYVYLVYLVLLNFKYVYMVLPSSVVWYFREARRRARRRAAPHIAMARGASPKRARARADGATTMTTKHYPPSVMDARATRAADDDDDDAGRRRRARARRRRRRRRRWARAPRRCATRATARRAAIRERPLDGALRDARRGDRGTGARDEGEGGFARGVALAGAAGGRRGVDRAMPERERSNDDREYGGEVELDARDEAAERMRGEGAGETELGGAVREVGEDDFVAPRGVRVERAEGANDAHAVVADD